DHLMGPLIEVRDRDVGLHPIARPVHLPKAHPGQVDNGLAQRLRRDRPRVDTDSADHVAPLDHRDALAQLRALNRGLLTGWAGADDDQVVIEVHRSRRLSLNNGRRALAPAGFSASATGGDLAWAQRMALSEG